MARDGQKLLGFVVGIAAIGLVLAVLGQRVLGLAAGPETEIITALKKAERGVEWPVGAYGTLVGAKLQYQRLQITLGPGGQTAIATGTLDFEGVFDARTKVSSLGLERIPFVLKGSDWEPVSTLAPRLTAVVQALEVRRRTLNAQSLDTDGGGLELLELASMRNRTYRSDAWFIRSERAEVDVAEDYRLTGDTRDRPVDEKATKRLSLCEDTLGSFSFRNGLF